MIIDESYMRQKYQLEIPGSILKECILNAQAFTASKITSPREIVTTGKDKRFILDLGRKNFFFDRNFDNDDEITGEDITIREIDEPNYEIYDRTDNLENIKEFYVDSRNRVVIDMDDVYPLVGNKLSFSFSITTVNFRGKKNENKLQLLKKFMGIRTIIEMLTTKKAQLMQAGITNFSINGVSIPIDGPGLKETIEEFERLLKLTYNDLIPIISEEIHQRYDWVNRRFRF